MLATSKAFASESNLRTAREALMNQQGRLAWLYASPAIIFEPSASVLHRPGCFWVKCLLRIACWPGIVWPEASSWKYDDTSRVCRPVRNCDPGRYNFYMWKAAQRPGSLNLCLFFAYSNSDSHSDFNVKSSPHFVGDIWSVSSKLQIATFCVTQLQAQAN
jgi:hypothetical protein